MKQSFDKILDRAADHHGGREAVEKLLPKVAGDKALAKVPDDRLLSLMTKCIFQSGFNWKVIENKWPGFEEAFDGFDLRRMAFLNDEQLDALGKDTRIVRNMQKIITVPKNAQFMLDVAQEHGSFARFIAQWPPTDQTGLWAVFKKRGARLGGATAQYFLRFAGKDSFIISRDVSLCLKASGIISVDTPTSKKDLAAVQDAFNAWHEETGRPYVHLSRIAAMSVGPH